MRVVLIAWITYNLPFTEVNRLVQADNIEKTKELASIVLRVEIKAWGSSSQT